MSKKISEWLKELPTPYRELALDNFKKQDMDDTARPSITSSCIALASAFDWYVSEEGYSYWSDVFDRLSTGDLSTDSNNECDIKKQLDEVTKQRDALAESLEIIASGGRGHFQWSMTKAEWLARKALSSVKGGSH